MEKRIDRLEVQQERQGDQISKLFSKSDATNTQLSSIQRSIDQTRWVIFGALGYFVLSEIGFIEALKLTN